MEVQDDRGGFCGGQRGSDPLGRKGGLGGRGRGQGQGVKYAGFKVGRAGNGGIDGLTAVDKSNALAGDHTAFR